MLKRSLIAALLACLVCAPAHAKTFIGVLWPMFGPLPAIGLVELVAELKMLPDVEVNTYVHQAWPSLVDDLNSQPPGTRTIVIGYSLGANATASVANNAKYVDEIIALQPSELSWNPDIKGGSFGRFIEVYNPNRWETWGGMGSKKLVGPNIEYIANHDSHPGAQFSAQFRDLVKTEVAKISREEREEIAAADKPVGEILELAYSEPAVPREALASAKPSEAKAAPPARPKPVKVASAAAPAAELSAKPAVAAPQPTAPPQLKTDAVADAGSRPDHLAFLEQLSRTVDSGALPLAPQLNSQLEPQLTADTLMAYAKRTYHVNPNVSASCLPACAPERL